MNVRELVAKFGVDFDDKGAKHAHHEVEGLKEGLKGLIGFVGGAELIKSTFEFVERQVQMANSVKVTSDRLGLTTDQLQKFRFAAEANAISSESADNALQQFSRRMAEAAHGGGDAGKAVHELGIKLKDGSGNVRPMNELLGDVADKMKDAKSDGDRLRIAFHLFGREGVQLAAVMKHGREGLAEYGAEAEELGGIISQDQVEASHEAEIAMHKWRFAMQGLKNEIMAHLLPGLTAGFNAAVRWFQKFREIEKGTHLVEAGMAALAFTAIKLSHNLLELIGVEGGFKGFLKAGLLLAVVVLIFDDIITYAKGGKSAIGDFLDAIGGAGTAVAVLKNIKETFEGIQAAIHDATTDLDKFVRLMNAPGTVFNKLFEAGTNAFIAPGQERATGRGLGAPLVDNRAEGYPLGYGPVDNSAQGDVPRAEGRGLGAGLLAEGATGSRGVGAGGGGGSHQPYRTDVLDRFVNVSPMLMPQEAWKKSAQADVDFMKKHAAEVQSATALQEQPKAPAPVTINQQIELNIPITGANDARATAKQIEDAVRRAHAEANRNALRTLSEAGERP